MKELLYFSSAWCSPCKALAPVMSELMQRYPITKIDIDQQQEIAQKYNVKSIPTTILLVNGVEVQRRTGAMPRQYYVNLFN
jgi:thioredoxin 1